jgi:serine/threonine protein kinase
MVPSNSQCDQGRLRELLDDRLTPKLQDELARHLETCEDCRKELESLAAGSDWWDDARQLLSTVINAKNTTSTDNVLSRDMAARNVEGPRLGFLSPSDDPTKLGRLGPYEIVKVIGRGGMGIVLKGYDTALNRHVAIKVLAPQWIHSEAARRRFAREARAAAAVVHENVIAIHAVDSANETPYLVMPYIDGISLQDKINRDGPLELKDILRISAQIADGLAAAHAQGLVHRDIKPANILLENGNRGRDCPNFGHHRGAMVDNKNGAVPFTANNEMGLPPLPENQRVLITDFGLARAVDDASFTRSCFIAGTPEYMAPEQANGEPVDHRIDLFSLGSVMYAMCAGQSPFRRETTMAVLRQICEGTPRPIREINPDMPVWLERIIARLHAKNPGERFQSAGETADLLRQWLAYVEQPSAHPRPRYPSRQWFGFSHSSKRFFSPTYLCIVSALLLLLAAITATEITGSTHLIRWITSTGGSETKAKPADFAADAQRKTPRATGNSAEAGAAGDTLFSERVAELWRKIDGLKTAFSAGGAAEVPPDAIAEVRSELIELQAELPEFRTNVELEQLLQIAVAVEQLKQAPPRPENPGGIDARLMEVNSRVEQLNQDLYRDFP